jgi:hypothetical protein
VAFFRRPTQTVTAGSGSCYRSKFMIFNFQWVRWPKWWKKFGARLLSILPVLPTHPSHNIFTVNNLIFLSFHGTKAPREPFAEPSAWIISASGAGVGADFLGSASQSITNVTHGDLCRRGRTKLRHLPDLIHCRTSTLALPTVQRLFADPCLQDHLRDRTSPSSV